MDFVKREEPNGNYEENYKVYLENLQKSHQIENVEYPHTPISMEQLHQAMQSSLNASSIVHNLQLPLSPRQMSTLMLKTNHISRNFAEIPAHFSRNLEIDLSHSLVNELAQNLRQDDLITQNLNRNIDLSLARTLGHEIDLQNGLAQTLVQNMTEDLRINDANLPQNLRAELPHSLDHEIDLSHQLNRQNLNQEILSHNESRVPPLVLQCALDNNHLIEQNLRLQQNMSQRLDQHIAQRLEQNLAPRIEHGGQRHAPALEHASQRLEHTSQSIDHMGQRLEQNVISSNINRLNQMGHSQRLVNEDLVEGQIDQPEHVLPMLFQIKSEQDDEEAYFYESVNQGMENIGGLNGHMQPEHCQPSEAAIQPEMYSVYPPHVGNIPALNPIDLYSRQQNYPQNFASRENPQNLVIHRQYENASPYPEEMKKTRQNSVEIDAKNLKLEQPKENLKPSDQNKIYYSQEFVAGKNENDSQDKLNEELSMNIKGEYVCYKCSEVFPSKRGLKQHAKACVENEETEKTGKFGCSQCAYRCQSPAILKIHERTHSGEKPFSCNFCDYKSGQKNNVAKHILVHMKEKPFRCQYCEYRCAQKNNLVVHERTHTGYKPFACPYCDYRTVQKPNLVKHMYLHTDQKPFSCDMCNYRCVQKTNLTKHKQRHMVDKDAKIVVKESKPYRPRQKSVKCSQCPYRCVQKSSMEKHMQFKHAELEYNGEGFEGTSVVKRDEIQNLSFKKYDFNTDKETLTEQS